MKFLIEAPSVEAVTAVARVHGWTVQAAAPDRPSPVTEAFSVKEAAAAFGVHIDTLRRWIDAGKIPSYRTPGGHRHVPVDALPIANA